MPTHVHFIIHMEGNVEKPVTLGNIIGAYKSLTTRAWLNHIKSTGKERSAIIWQRDFDDRAIIDVISLEARRQYIHNNPEKWESTH
jgi:putative transposase